jgi:hypothetical protein
VHDRAEYVLLALLLAFALGIGGCLTLPSEGTLVYVDHRTGKWWSGEGVMTEVSADQTKCKIAARNTALIVETKWVPCKYVHPRTPQTN